MTIEFDDKGKYFTDIISKVAIPATIQTVTHRIEGSIHIRLEGRIKDELDSDEPFLAVTSGKVFDQNGNVIYECEFIGIRRSQIVWVIPKDELDHGVGGGA
jgi:hypothetical protein